jgi:RNA polymerase sigma-70 factor (ECF subfamily)
MNSTLKQTLKLIKGCMNNERSAQEELYKLFYAEMLRLCYRYLKTDELAKEALNSGFLKVFQNIADFDAAKGELQVWIKTIMIRTCIDLNRKELTFALKNGAFAEENDHFISPSVLEKLYAEDLFKSIRQLPVNTQMVFNLYVIDGYNHKEIGEQLNIGESTSRWHLTEAKKQLRALLKPAIEYIDHLTEQNKKAK